MKEKENNEMTTWKDLLLVVVAPFLIFVFFLADGLYLIFYSQTMFAKISGVIITIITSGAIFISLLFVVVLFASCTHFCLKNSKIDFDSLKPPENVKEN